MSIERFLIMVGDDLGYCSERNRGVFEAFQRGSVTRASLMVNAAGSLEAVNQARSMGLPLGLHLNVTEGSAVSDLESVNTLLNGNGYFWGKMGFRQALSEKRIDLTQVEHEMSAQLERFQTFTGRLPLYVDGHQHVHILPGLAETFACVLRDYGVRSTRLPYEPDIAKCAWIDAPRRGFYQDVSQQALEAKNVFDRWGICYSDCFIGMATMGQDMTVERLCDGILNAFIKSELSVEHIGRCGKQPEESELFDCNTIHSEEKHSMDDMFVRNSSTDVSVRNLTDLKQRYSELVAHSIAADENMRDSNIVVASVPVSSSQCHDPLYIDGDLWDDSAQSLGVKDVSGKSCVNIEVESDGCMLHVSQTAAGDVQVYDIVNSEEYSVVLTNESAISGVHDHRTVHKTAPVSTSSCVNEDVSDRTKQMYGTESGSVDNSVETSLNSPDIIVHDEQPVDNDAKAISESHPANDSIKTDVSTSTNSTAESLHITLKTSDIDGWFRPVVCEYMTHPGYPSRSPEAGCGEGPDEFACSADRVHELNLISSPEFAKFLKTHRIQLISDISQVHEMRSCQNRKRNL